MNRSVTSQPLVSYTIFDRIAYMGWDSESAGKWITNTRKGEREEIIYLTFESRMLLSISDNGFWTTHNGGCILYTSLIKQIRHCKWPKKNTGLVSPRSLWSFTLRKTRRDFINVTLQPVFEKLGQYFSGNPIYKLKFLQKYFLDKHNITKF